MQKFFQSLIASVLAISIASPVCCCDFAHEPASTEVSSCCGGGEEKETPDHDCGCAKMTAATEWKAPEAVVCNVVELPAFAEYELISFKVLPHLIVAERGHDSWIDAGPPARRRALLQCFLI